MPILVLIATHADEQEAVFASVEAVQEAEQSDQKSRT